MYGPPPVAVVPVVPVARRSGLASAPTLAISCLLFILFLIAATIVLALIPIYLPRKDTGANNPSDSGIITYPGTVGADGLLDAQARANLARAIELEYGLPTGSVTVSALGAVTPGGGKRKRGERGLRRVRRGSNGAGGTQVLVFVFRVRSGRRLTHRIFTTVINLDKSNNDGPLQVTVEIFVGIPDSIRALLNLLGLTSSGDTTTTASGGAAGTTSTTAAGGAGGTASTTAAGGAGGTASTTAAGGAGGTASTTAAGGAGGTASTTAAGGGTVTTTTTANSVTVNSG